MVRRKLIVNADDFGISPGVNRGIIESHLDGIVTSASLMPNMSAVEDALERRLNAPRLSIGVHFNLTAGGPVAPAGELSSLVGPDGRFFSPLRFLARASARLIDPRHVSIELDAQIRRVTSAGIAPAHLNSHHHIHLHPRLLPIVEAAARRHGIGWIRAGAADPLEQWKNRGASGLEPAAWRGHLRLGLWRLFSRPRRPGADSPEHLLGLSYVRPGRYEQALRDWIGGCRPGTTELVCHPGHPDAGLLDNDGWTRMREEELSALRSSSARKAMEALGVELTGTWAGG